MPIHNPDNLDASIYNPELGYRLLDRDEVFIDETGLKRTREIQGYYEREWRNGIIGLKGNNPLFTYRTKLSKKELAQKRGLIKTNKNHKLTSIFAD